MNPMPLTRTPDFEVPILRVLNDSVSGVSHRQDVILVFLSDYRDRMPPDFVVQDSGGNRYKPLENRLDHARRNLVRMGFVDTPDVGYWRITDQAKRWLSEHPDEDRISSSTKRRVKRQESSKSAVTDRKTPSVSSGLTFDMLEQTRKIMDPEQFRSIWGKIYDQLLAEERAKAITHLSDRQLLQAARQPVRRIQDFLQGRGNDAPKSEDVCDWIQLCYTLGLYREGAALWQYVQRDEVNSWLFERSKRISAVCRTKIGT